MPTFLSPDFLLAVAKVTAFLIIILALAPFLKNPVHRARFWAGTILALPIIFFTSFSTPLIGIIPLNTTLLSQLASLQTVGRTETQDGFEKKTRTLSVLPNHKIATWDIEQDGDLPLTNHPDSLTNPAPNTPPPTPVNLAIEPQNLPALKTNHWIFTVAFVGTLLTLLPLLLSNLRILRLTKSKALDPPLALWIKIHQNSRHTPRLLFTTSPAAPFACGIFQPCVILPDDSPSWSLRRIRSTLLHEAEHLHRHDPLVRFASSFIRALFWFHPLVWLAHRQLIVAQEQACDQAALHHGIPAEDYAEDLLSSLNHAHLTPPEALSMAKWSQLGNRVRRVLQTPKPTKMKSIVLTASLSLITFVALTSIGFSQQSNKKPLPKTIDTDTAEENDRGAILDRNGKPVAINDQEGQRTYPFGEPLGNVTGFVNFDTGYKGLEKYCDRTLAKGFDVKVSLDGAIQEYCYRLLATQKFSGSIIVQNPNSGEIISMVTYPSFDPNLYIPSGFAVIFDDSRDPTLDRSTIAHTPGSIAKLFVALAGEYAGLDNPKVHCKGFINFGKIKIRDWKTNRDELLQIPGALEQSCNTYFMDLATRAGANPIKKVGKLLHLNESPLIEFPSSNSRYQGWNIGEEPSPIHLAITAIGQGPVSLTPIHVCSLTSAISSGSWHQPHLLLADEKTKPSIPLVGQGKITASSLEVIREGMHLAVHGERGTAKRAAVPGIQLAGKTGTAQVSKDQRNSWFTGFGPFEKPEYTVTVLLEGAESGGKYAAPMAAEVFKKLLTKDE